ncbi:MAG: NAD(P)/FAD-dependent oxidoreductase [Acetobacteraceae bacterium]
MAEWDVVVIGGGAAGLSAAATVAARGLRCLVIDRMGGGGELMNLGTLHDMDEALTGPDLAARLLEDATNAGAELGIAEVSGLRRDGDRWRVVTDDEPHIARTVILAVGLAPGTLGLDNEAAFEGRGLSHCAACDGPLYAGQSVVVAGADRWAQLEASELVGTASDVTLVTQGQAAPQLEGVLVRTGRVTRLHGDNGLESVTISDEQGAAPLPAYAIFIQTGRRPSLGFVPEDLACDDAGRIVTDPALTTNLPELYAVGDARSGSPRTIAAAIADGQHAAASSPLPSPLGKPPE